MKPNKILVIRLKQIGDALLSLPVCNSLRLTYPDAQIDYLVYQHITPLLHNQPAIDNLLVITPEERNNKSLYLKKALWLRQQKYDLVIDMINVPISAWLCKLSGAKQTIGFDKKRWRSKLYKIAVLHPEVGDTLSKKLAILQGLPDKAVIDRGWQITVDDAVQKTVKQKLLWAGIKLDRPLFFIAATSRREYKFWPLDYMKQVLQHLKQKYNAQLLINWTPGPEGDFVGQLLAELDDTNDVFADIDLSLAELPEAISLCDFFFGNDGGPAHMAVGTGVPSLAVFSPINEKENWLPLNKPLHQGIDLKDALNINEHQRREMAKQIKQNLGEYYRKITPEIVQKKLDRMIPIYTNLDK